jgi:hypothetical protein
MIRKAKELSPEQRMAVEALISQLSEQDDVSVRRLSTSPAVSKARRREIPQNLQEYFAQVDEQRQPMSAADADSVLDEALRSTRPGYRPVA